jgi:hypothetical protein
LTEKAGERGAAAEDVSLHLCEGYAELPRDLIVGDLLKMKEHQRHPLVIRQLFQGLVDAGAPLLRRQTEQRILPFVRKINRLVIRLPMSS